MIAVDTNILVYAHRRDSEFHDRAVEVVGNLAVGRVQWAIPWPCVHEFLAIVTHPRIYDPPSTADQALDQVRAWISSPSLTLLSERAGHLDHLRRIVLSTRSVGPRVHDARIAALCESNGVTTLWSVDRDFSRFKGLRVQNPFRAEPKR